MGEYKILAYAAMGVAFFGYRVWLRSEKEKGRGDNFLHKDISGVLVIIGITLAIYVYAFKG